LVDGAEESMTEQEVADGDMTEQQKNAGERRWEPHTCAGCLAHFEVGYREPRDDAPLATAEIACPKCGKRKPVSVPKGTEKDLLVERDDDKEVDVGTGG
jgi:DNA-directed RNA polymerase subunit RPC12/RpoP